eukprot:767330-Hanusia_phi.AAC.4
MKTPATSCRVAAFINFSGDIALLIARGTDRNFTASTRRAFRSSDLVRHAVIASAPPTAVFHPKLSPMNIDPNAAAHSGSVENIRAVSELESFPTTTVSIPSTNADDMIPIHTSARHSWTVGRALPTSWARLCPTA